MVEELGLKAEYLHTLASAAWDFLVASLAIALIVGVVLEVTRDFGLRHLVNFLLVNRFANREYRPWLKYYPPRAISTIYSLAYGELSARILANIRLRIETDMNSDAKDSDAKAIMELERVELDVNYLHSNLRTADTWLSILIPLCLGGILLSFFGVFDMLSLLILGTAAVMTPVVRELFRRVVRL